MEAETAQEREIRWLKLMVNALNLKLECLIEDLNIARKDQQRYQYLKANDPFMVAAIGWRIPGANEFGEEDLDKLLDVANGS